MDLTLRNFSDEAYGESAALRYHIFESRKDAFALKIAPLIHAFYKKNNSIKSNEKLLDVACGIGQLSAYFLEKGFDVVGFDRSAYMLKHARDKNAVFIDQGKAKFFELDASNFQLEPEFGLAVCSFNGLNHLSNLEQVQDCINNVHDALVPGGYFIFDINTELGLKNVVDTMSVDDNDEEIVVRKRIFDGERVILSASGCFQYKGKWIRYRETIFKIVIDPINLRKYMLDNGWASVNFTTDDLNKAVKNPELEKVLYLVAKKNI